MPNMEYFESAFHPHYHHDQMSSHYADVHPTYPMAPQPNPMIEIPSITTKTNETKPRLGKDEVDILEREFKKNPKPTTQTKRQFAEDMGVDLARINNWFQNRRAKRKQEKKQEALEAGQAQDPLGCSAPSSPDFFNSGGSNSYFGDNHMMPMQQSSNSYSLMNGAPPAVASYSRQYSDPSGASIESLQRTIAAAQAAEDFHGFVDEQDPLAAFTAPNILDHSNGDRAQFQSPDDATPQFHRAYTFPSTFANHIYNASSQSVSEVQHSPGDSSSHTPTPFNTFPTSSGLDSSVAQAMAAFPSQLLPQSHEGHAAQQSDNSESQSPEDSSGSSLALGFKYDVVELEQSPPPPPPPPSCIPFKSLPPPMDIASRRKKVQVKPAALIADTLRGRPSLGPRTVSHPDGFRRPADSPLTSPMPRIVSAGGNRNVLSGRIYKSGFESAQRSPINLGGFADAGSFLEHNYHALRNPPSLTAGSSLNSSLAPPTPMSPRERESPLVKREGSRSTASPVEAGMNFVFNTGIPGCFTTMEGDQNLASPPETPQAHMVVHSTTNNWPAGMEFDDKQWNFDVPDEPLYTPGQDTFNLELHMPQPSYLSSISQPATPAFGQFNPSFIFGYESPRFKNESPQYMLSSQSHAEYSFPESHQHYPIGMSPSMTKQKTFQFSHTTPADFSEK